LELKNINKRRTLKLFKDFSYRVIKLKYFILIVAAMLLEIVTLIIYIFNNEDIVDFDLMTASVLYGVTSLIIITLAVSALVLIKTDKSRDKKMIEQLNDFRRECFKLRNEYSGDINGMVKNFDSERGSIEAKINYAIEISEKYDGYIKKFSKIKVPAFLRDAFNYKLDNLNKEKLFFTKFSLLADPGELEEINKESDLADENFSKELGNIEKNLKIIV
jgi:uncharacterized integral membrane protein